MGIQLDALVGLDYQLVAAALSVARLAATTVVDSDQRGRLVGSHNNLL